MRGCIAVAGAILLTTACSTAPPMADPIPATPSSPLQEATASAAVRAGSILTLPRSSNAPDIETIRQRISAVLAPSGIALIDVRPSESDVRIFLERTPDDAAVAAIRKILNPAAPAIFGITLTVPPDLVIELAPIQADLFAIGQAAGVTFVDLTPGNGTWTARFDGAYSAELAQAVSDRIGRAVVARRAQRPAEPQAEASARRMLSSVVAITAANGAQGTGFFISRDGYILTNAHVAGEVGRTPTVVLYDGRRMTGRVVGVVERGWPDVAVIKIDNADVPPVTFADGGTPAVGQLLLSIGMPGGYGSWIVAGGRLLSAQRTLVQGVSLTELRADIPSAPGDSGSPIFDVDGRVVGLLYGASAVRLPIEPSPFAIYWTWGDFAQLNQRVTTGIAASDARAAANAIIAKQGNVP